MKKLVLYVTSLFAASLFAVSLAGATSFTVSGSNNPGGYIASSPLYPAQVVPVSATPAGPWVSGSWMTFNNTDQTWPMDAGSGNLPGSYYYLTSFSLTGLNPTTAVLQGSWAADDSGQMLLNGNLVSTSSGYSALTTFNITSGFEAGYNSIEFIVENNPYPSNSGLNPTGLLVNITEANAAPVPEPGTMMLLGAGFLGLAVYGKRRKNA